MNHNEIGKDFRDVMKRIRTHTQCATRRGGEKEVIGKVS
jgi:hypothetical protein